jgi:carboxymethylenebutenolidase
LEEGHLWFESTGGRAPAFFVKPASPAGSVVVLHEVWGLVPHIENVCKRISKLGFTAVAPDLYWKHKELLVPEKIRAAMEGVWELSLLERRDINKVREALTKKGLPHEIMQVATTLYNKSFRDQILDNAVACVKYVYERTPKVATLGFCLGGGISARVATRFPQLSACIVFYGEPPDTPEVQKVRAPILTIHAEQDEIINSKIPEFVHSVLASGKDLTLKVYPATRHGFFNETNREIYNGAAAEDAWELTKWFLSRKLRQ